MTDITQLYIIETYDSIDYTCRDCAVKFATDNGLTWNRPATYDYTRESENNCYTYEDTFGQVETDYPVACDCGQWLDARLTQDGINYIEENIDSMPSFIINYYLGR